MNRPRTSGARRWAGAILIALSAPLHAQQTTDTAATIAGMHEFSAVCRKEGGKLWGQTLCGRLVAADAGTRFAVTSTAPPGGMFTRYGDIYVGRIPEDVRLSNTSLDWGGNAWAAVLLPLERDRFARIARLAHESFHRLQPALGLSGSDALNAHLDTRDGRYWLRLELRALAAALETRGSATRVATRDALLFRAERRASFPGADTLEAQLERQEGLAEYTGDRMALDATRAPLSRVASDVRATERRPSFVRSFAYGTGPAIGLLLDRYQPRWRTRAANVPMADALARATRFIPPGDLCEIARERAQTYGGTGLAAEEDARERERLARTADFTARLVDGPVLIVHQQSLSRNFNPNTLVPLPPHGTVYPTGSFKAEWGTLEVTSAGALVANDFGTVRVPAPAEGGSRTEGRGWTLKMADGWSVRPGPRAGDLVVAR